MGQPTEKEIDEQANKAHEVIDDPNNRGFFGQSYEEGVINTINWMRGDYDEAPMDNE